MKLVLVICGALLKPQLNLPLDMSTTVVELHRIIGIRMIEFAVQMKTIIATAHEIFNALWLAGLLIPRYLKHTSKHYLHTF